MTDIRQAIAEERRELAAMLAGLPAARWDAPTLCAGWRVREVVAHMTMPFRYSLPRFMLELAKARGNFKKHGVTFEEASSVFFDPLATTYRTLTIRWTSAGRSPWAIQ